MIEQHLDSPFSELFRILCDNRTNRSTMRFAGAALIPLLLVASRRLPAQERLKVGVAQRSFVPKKPYSWRGAKTHALLTTVWYPADSASIEQPQWLGPPDSALFARGSGGAGWG